MTTDRVPSGQPTPMQTHHPDHGHGGHRWMMIACCIPMLMLAVVLVATGVAGRRSVRHPSPVSGSILAL